MRVQEIYDDLISFINDPSVEAIPGNYRGQFNGTHYLQRETGLMGLLLTIMVIIQAGWKLRQSQLETLLQSQYVK